MSDIVGFNRKHIILGVTGGIACYKACQLARELGRLGSDVQVVMTEAATAFVTPLTFQALTGREVRISLLDPKAEAGMGHIELARWADLILVAPTTANTLALLAEGRAPDLLTTIWLAASCPKAVVPAMNQQMWTNLATQNNLKTLEDRGTIVIGPESGIQACGDFGVGRMTEPTTIIELLAKVLNKTNENRLNILITAGPTHESIDPVRYIANHSSGKMGFALAQSAQHFGARVTLITGPVHLRTPDGIHRIDVTTASDMLAAVLDHIIGTTIFIGAAAVCDMRPKEMATSKLKKAQTDLSTIELVENPDIIKIVSDSPNRPILVVGCAAETDQINAHATEKLSAKGLDWIIANDVSNGQIFGQDDTNVTLIGHTDKKYTAIGTKQSVADELISILTKGLKD